MPHRTPVLAALALALAAPAFGQGGVVAFGHVGGSWPTINLHADGDDFRPGVSYGGGVALQVSGSLALRGNVTIARTAYRGSTLVVADDGMRRSTVAAELQVGFPRVSAWVPYLVLGGGMIRTVSSDALLADVTSPMVRFGGGVNKVGGLFVWFAEVAAVGSRFTGYSNTFHRLQLELQGHVGLALGIPF